MISSFQDDLVNGEINGWGIIPMKLKTDHRYNIKIEDEGKDTVLPHKRYSFSFFTTF